ncbi:MAG: PIN domain-containing protein [Myxococcales bacterium]|nr:PIN domain-containing protein [Myxococcales bacterium]
MIVIDTSIFVDAERKREQAEARLRELIAGDLADLAVCSVTILELTRSPKLTPTWRQFYSRLFDTVSVLEVDRPAAEMGAAIARERQQEGQTMQNTDALIAGCAAAAGADLLLTSDDDFAGIRHFAVELVRPS